MSDYARKITPICCHAYRVNRVWEEAENRWVNRLTIEPQTFCGLKKNRAKNQEDTAKKSTVCNNYAIEISKFFIIILLLLLLLCLPRLPDKPLGVML